MRTPRAAAGLVGVMLLGACGARTPVFRVVVLGGAGGLQEDNLSAFLVQARGAEGWLALDAGTLRAGIETAARLRSVDLPAATPEAAPAERFIREHIRAYAISHPHLDHVAGLVVNSTDDASKPILGSPHTLGVLRDSVFNWRLWPNFGSDGERPLRRYAYRAVGSDRVDVAGTGLQVEAYPLSHGAPYPSTAFLVRAGEDALLYLGDTGADALEGSDHLRRLWRVVGPLARERRLRAVFLECSYPESRPDTQLFGHLKPSLFMTEVGRLAAATVPNDAEDALRGLRVVVTHVKPGRDRGLDAAERIRNELAERNRWGVTLEHPAPGAALDL